MLVNPSKLKLEKIVKNRTLNFETPKRTHGNLVLIATQSEEHFKIVLKSKLFKPQQLMATYVPRVIRPMNRIPVRLNQADIYKDISSSTSGKAKIGKLAISSYNERNLAYNIVPEYSKTVEEVQKRRQGVQLNKYMSDYLDELIFSKVEEVNYEKSYLIFPMIDFIDNFTQQVMSRYDNLDPAVLFLKSIYRETFNKASYEGIHKIIFFNPNADALLAIDLNEIEIEKDKLTILNKVNRLNRFNSGEDLLDDEEVISAQEVTDEEEELENTIEQIKELVLKNFAKKLNVKNLNDFEAADKKEKDLITAIEARIEEYIKDPANEGKSFAEMIKILEADNEIKLKAINYIESKKIGEERLKKMAKNLQKEVEAISSIEDLISTEDNAEPDYFDVDNADERIKYSSLSNLDEEYNKKQAAKDLSEIITSFSESTHFPMTVTSVRIEDTSDDFKKVDTVFIRYTTPDGQRLSATIDIPKIVDKRYFYLGGNKKVLTKQLFRLPIVKTKPDRVEVTTNFNKITIERSAGKVSRKNAYILKLIQDYKKNPNFTIKFGSNGIANAKFQNDYEYEELSETLTSIENIKYKIYFNRETIQEEIDLLDVNEKHYTTTSTPLGFVKQTGKLIVIKSDGVYQVATTGVDFEEKVAESLYQFMYYGIFEKSEKDKMPVIGKSFVYTRMSVFGTTYPVFPVLGIMNGLTEILKRYKVKYQVSEKRILGLKGTMVEVEFLDKFLYYEDTVKNGLLLNVLYMMNTEMYNLKDFDLDEPYMDFFIERLDQPIYIKNTIITNMDVMVDPITKSVLRDLKMPTNMTDILLEANTMLVNNTYKPQNDVTNYRVRGNEIVYAMMYQIMAEAYLKFQRAKLNGRGQAVLDIPRNKLVSKLLMEPNVNDHSTLNPVLEMENIATISAKGFRGVNLDAAYTMEVRAYDDSMVGFISPNSTPQGNAGVARALSYNPKITTVRGYIPSVEMSELDPANILSPGEMLASFTSTQADPMRQSINFVDFKIL